MKNEVQFFLSKKATGKRMAWYAYFPIPGQPGKYISKSVERLRRTLGIPDITPITRESEAAIITQKALDAGIVKHGSDDPLVVDYFKDFWDFDNSDYIRRRNRKKADSIGKDYCASMKGVFTNHAEKRFPKRLRLSQLATPHIEAVINSLIDEGSLSNGSISRVMQSLSIPLREAARIGMIASNPMLNVEPLSTRSRERGILTESELQTLMAYMKEGSEAGTFDTCAYLACVLSAYTGMRSGEIRAIKKENIRLVSDEHGIITIKEAYAVYAGFKTPKGKRERQVPAPRWLCEAMIETADYSPYGGSLVFWSKSGVNQQGREESPVSANFFRDKMYKALDKALGMKEKERMERDITFHSFRHYFVTWMRGSGKVSEGLLREVVGHRDSKTTDLYTHQTDEQLLMLGKIADNILQFPIRNTDAERRQANE